MRLERIVNNVYDFSPEKRIGFRLQIPYLSVIMVMIPYDGV